jgi:methionine-rich copper-binding protein CopC
MKRIPIVVLAAGAGLIGVLTALAHAEPAKVIPGLGANLVERPSQVEIVMTQDLARREGANDIDVLDSTGAEVTTIAAVIDNGDRRKISVPLPDDLKPGSYTVKWKTLSAEDGDAEDGEYVFVYDPSKPADPGRVELKEAPPTVASGDGETGAPPAARTSPTIGGGDDGMSWILVVAVGVAGLAIGGGATFLLVQRRV